MRSLYIIGSLRNRELVMEVANAIRATGMEAFDDWLSPGPKADDEWKSYEEARGHTYRQALEGWAAEHVYAFDRHHLDRCDGAVLILPSGKSCHLEAGYMAATKPLFILMDTPDRWDIMYLFATGIAFSQPELLEMIHDSAVHTSNA